MKGKEEILSPLLRNIGYNYGNIKATAGLANDLINIAEEAMDIYSEQYTLPAPPVQAEQYSWFEVAYHERPPKEADYPYMVILKTGLWEHRYYNGASSHTRWKETVKSWLERRPLPQPQVADIKEVASKAWDEAVKWRTKMIGDGWKSRGNDFNKIAQADKEQYINSL